jgi:hypothetical protein
MRLLAVLLAWVLFASSPAHAQKRIALIIGNAAYKNAPTLQNPRNDAQDVSAALQRLGFETIVGLDLDRDGMEVKSIAFSRAARDADVALVYYSGHAMQRRGINYLMPVDAVLHDDADLRRLTRVDEIVDDLNQAKSLRILVLDACRVNPLADELSRSMELTRGPPVDRGIARMIAPKGMIISFATQPGQTAADGQGRNSPYTMAFLKNIETPGEIGAVFHHMTADVYNETQGKQVPELSLSYIGDFYLNGGPNSEVAAPVNNPTASSTVLEVMQIKNLPLPPTPAQTASPPATQMLESLAHDLEPVTPAAPQPTHPAQVHTGWMIQVGALPDEREAKTRLDLAQSKAPDLLRRAEPFTDTYVKGDKTYFRARFSGFDKDQAEAACEVLKRNVIPCMTLLN